MNPVDELYKRIDAANLWEKAILLRRNAFLKHPGTIDTHLYYIVSGSVKVALPDEPEEHILRFGYRDNFVSALDSFITGQPSELSIQALKKTEVKVLPKQPYLAFIHSAPEHKQLWDTLLEQLLLQQMEREIDILIRSPQERYRRVFARSPRLFQEVPHKYIAAYLRMSPETLSRLKKS